MNSRIYIDGRAVDPIDKVWEEWDGLPMTSQEIADKAGINESTVRAISCKAFRKIRDKLSTPELMEYLNDY